MTNEEYVEEVYFLAHKNGILDEFRGEVDKLKKTNENLTMCEVVEIVERKYKLI